MILNNYKIMRKIGQLKPYENKILILVQKISLISSLPNNVKFVGVLSKKKKLWVLIYFSHCSTFFLKPPLSVFFGCHSHMQLEVQLGEITMCWAHPWSYKLEGKGTIVPFDSFTLHRITIYM